jgi:hypothetical protein
MQSSSNPTSDRKAAHTSLGVAQSSGGTGTFAEALNEIRDLLHGLGERGEEDAPPAESAPAVDEPCKTKPDMTSGGTAATPGPVPAARPQAAPSLPHGGTAVAASASAGAPPRLRAGRLTLVGLAGLGVAGLAAGLGATGRLGLPPLAASTAVKGRAGTDNGSEAIARAALPPVRNVAIAKTEAAPKPPAAVAPLAVGPSAVARAPRNAGLAAWRLPPPARTGTAAPVPAPGALALPIHKAKVHAEIHGADLAAAREGAPPQPHREALGQHAAQNREARAGRHRAPPYQSMGQPTDRFSRAIATSEGNRPRPPLSAPMRQSRAAERSPTGAAGSNSSERFAFDHVGHAPAATAGWRRPVAWNGGSLAPVPSASADAATVSNDSDRSIFGPAEYAPAFAAREQRSVDRNRNSAAPVPLIPQNAATGSDESGRSVSDRSGYAPAAAAREGGERRRFVAWDGSRFSPEPRTVIEGPLPPFPVPPPPPPPGYRYSRMSPDWGSGQAYSVGWRPPFFDQRRPGGPAFPPPPQ